MTKNKVSHEVKPTPAQRRLLLAISKGENYPMTRGMEAACLLAGWIVRQPLVHEGITYYPAQLTEAGKKVIGL